MTQRGVIDPEYAVREGWVRDADNEISMDGYNAFIQITTSDGTSGFKVQNNAGAVAFSADSAGDGYVAQRLGIKTENPTTELEVMGKTKTTQFQLPTGAIDGYVLICDSLGNGAWEPLSGADGYSIFGNHLLYVVSESTSATTSETYQQKLRLTTANLTSGNYVIHWSCEAQAPEGNSKETRLQIQLDDTSVLGEPSTEENLGFSPISGTIIWWLSGVHAIDMDWKRVGSAGTASVRRARLIMWRAT